MAAVTPAGAVVKAILETATFNGPSSELAARAAIDGGAAWVKTSTGYHPSGGIRSLTQAQFFIDAGAGRLGTSRGVALLQELQARD